MLKREGQVSARGTMGNSISNLAENQLREQFASLDLTALPEAEVLLRKEAFSRLMAHGLPDRKVETWCYTDLCKAMQEAFWPVRATENFDISQFLGEGLKENLLLVQGRLQSEVEGGSSVLPAGIQRVSAQEFPGFGSVISERNRDPIGDLNLAFSEETLVLHVGKESRRDTPLHLKFVSGGEKPCAVHGRVRVILAPGAELTLVESCLGTGVSQGTYGLEFVLGEGASLEHVRIQDVSLDSQFLSVVDAHVGAQARFDSFLLSVGGKFTRNETRLRFTGEEAVAHIGGVLALSGAQVGDATVFVDHAVPRCTSRERFRFVLDDRARGVFQGTVLVRPGAQQTDGKQSSDALLLSPDSEMNAKPELEIYADDVQCGHGATMGQLNEEALFYLCARGIPEKQARTLLVQGFLGEILEDVRDESLRSLVLDRISRWLAARG